LLELVAVAGRPIAVDVAVAAAEASAGAARSAIAQLRAAQLVRTARVREEAALDTFHDRIRETTIKLLDGERLTRRHARLVAAIEASRAPDPEALAGHCVGAGERERAGEFADKAGEQAAAAFAFDRAAQWFRKAIDWRALEGAAARDLRRKLADALANAGRGAEAGREYLGAANGLTGGERADLQRRAAQQLLTSGCMDEGIAVVRDVLRSVGSSYPTSQSLAVVLFLLTSLLIRVRGYDFRERSEDAIRADVLRRIDTFLSLNMGLGLTDNLRGRYFTNRFVLGALGVGEPHRVAIALACEAANVSASGPSTERRVRRIEERLERLQHGLGSARVAAMVPFTQGWTRYFFGRFAEAAPLLVDAAERFRDLVGDNTWWRNTSRVWLFGCLWFLGRIRELRALASECREDAERRGDAYMSVFLSTGNANALWLAEDRPDEAIRAATAVFDRWPQVANDVQRYFALVACVLADLYLGRGRSAYDRLLAGWPRLRKAFLLRVPFARSALLHLRARAAFAALVEDPSDGLARRDASRCVRALSREAMPHALAMSQSVAAALALLDGDTGAALRLYAESARRFDAQSMALYAAACRYRQGEALGGAEGRALVEAAEAFLRSETIKNPARMFDVLVPGVGGREARGERFESADTIDALTLD
jgi:hypothetical protein